MITRVSKREQYIIENLEPINFSERFIDDDEEQNPLDLSPEEVCWYLRKYDDDDYKRLQFDIDLLRGVVGWARKSAEVEDVSLKMQWDQMHWIGHHQLGKAELITLDVGEFSGTAGYREIKPAEEGFCKTTGCIAGNIAMTRGEPIWTPAGNTSSGKQLYSADAMVTGESVEDFAAAQLGITQTERNLLFDGHNLINDIELFSESFSLRRGLTF